MSGLLNELGPIARVWIVFGTDPVTGKHQLEGQYRKSSGKANTGEDVHYAFVRFCILVILHLEGFSLRSA